MVVFTGLDLDRPAMPKRHPNEPILQRLGQVIWQRREALGLSREALGERLGTDAKNIYRLESGEENVGYLRLARIAEALQLELAALVAEPSDEVPWLLRLVQEGWSWRPPSWQAAGRCLEVLDLRPHAGLSPDQPEPQRLGWAEPPAGLGPVAGLFMAQISGDSMAPELQDGQWAIFSRTLHGANLLGQRALVSERGAGDLVRFVVKEIAAVQQMDGEAMELVLRSRNKRWPDRTVRLDLGGDVAVVGVLVRALGPRS